MSVWGSAQTGRLAVAVAVVVALGSPGLGGCALNMRANGDGQVADEGGNHAAPNSGDQNDTANPNGSTPTAAGEPQASNPNGTTPTSNPEPQAPLQHDVPVTPVPSTEQPTRPLQPGDGAMRLLGRTEVGVTALTWPGSGVAAAFVGTEVALHVAAVDGNNFIKICVDGNATSVLPISGSQKLLVGPLPAGRHTLTASKMQESRLGTLKVLGISGEGDGTAALPAARRIEVVGDSIALGYGMGAAAPCTNTAATEDATASFGALAAAALGADYALIAASGKGLVRNDTADANTNPITMAQIYTWQQANNSNVAYSFPAAAHPQAVVVALGTNDFEYRGFDGNKVPYAMRPPIDGNAFAASMVSFVRNIQARYPGVQVLLCASPMLTNSYPTDADAQHMTHLNALHSAAQALGSNVTVVDFPAMPDSAAKGCGGHPSRATQAHLGQLLTAALKASLGW